MQRGVVHLRDDYYGINMAGRQNVAEKLTELDLKSLDLESLGDHEVTLGIDIKEKEKADPDATPPKISDPLELGVQLGREYNSALPSSPDQY